MYRNIVGAAALAAAAAGGLVVLLTELARAGGSAPRTPDDTVALGVLSIGVLVLGWYLATALAALVCLTARAAGRAWVVGERRLTGWGAPLARRLLLTGGSAAVVAAATISPAVATPIPADLGPAATVADDLGWGATDDESTAEPDAGTEAPEPSEEPSAEPGPTLEPAASTTSPESYTVAAGDSLWTIAEQHLPEGSSAADIAAAWPEWHAQNHDVIGENPDLIHPGQVLIAPDHDLEEHA